MKLTMRMYQTEDDWWRIREFLRQVFLLNGRRALCWHISRLDYWRWHGIANLGDGKLENDVFIWETADGQITAVLNREGPGDAFLQIHPGFHSADLLEEMIVTAEKHLTHTRIGGKPKLSVWADSHDEICHAILARRGYTKGNAPECQWRRLLDAAIPDVPIPSGYIVRALGDGLELLERCYASGLGFHKGDIKIAVNNRNDPTWYRNVQTAPLYRRDLDLIAVASDGSIASFATIWLDDVTRSACFEPVATVPAHQRRGLAKAIMIEGLHRLKRMGAVMAFVSGYSSEANTLYQSVIGKEFDLSEPWSKEFPDNLPNSKLGAPNR